MKRHRLFALLLAGLLALGAMGGVVLAQGGEEGGNSPLQGFASRVAGILGLDEVKVQDAFQQASTEMQDDAMQQKLARMVEQGKLTQQEADEYQAWDKDRPQSLGQGFGLRRFGPRGFFGGFMRGGHWGQGMGVHGGISPSPTPEPIAY